MCFYYSGECCEVYEERIVKARKEYPCTSCKRGVAIGEQHISIFSVYEGHADRYRLCNRCTQDFAAIHRHEIAEGCEGAESWPPIEEISSLMMHGNGDEGFREEFDGDEEGGYVLFWPYGVPHAAKVVDLWSVPEMAKRFRGQLKNHASEKASVPA